MSTRVETIQKSPCTRVAVIERGERVRAGWIPCVIDQEITFRTAGLESYCFSNREPVVLDAFLVAATVDFCDRSVRRPCQNWGREFEVRIPVHDPDCWTGQVKDRLVDALAFLTGDRWHFEFHPRKTPFDIPQQSNFEIPDPTAAILPFSEGLDSRITSRLIEFQRGKRLTRVRLGLGKGSRLNNAQERQPFATVPYKVGRSGHRFPESSARSRGFKFMMLSGIAAYLSKGSEVIIPESGQGALGPALVAVGQSYEDYRNHPRFAAKMTDFLSALLVHKVRFTFPRIWYTKGETLREYVECVKDSWADTRSCWQQSRQVSVNHHLRQCGICAACMLRRLSVHAAGLAEPPETYVWESLSAKTFEQGAAKGFTSFTRALHEYALAGTLHMDHLAAVAGSPLHAETIRRTAAQIAPTLGLSAQQAEEKLCRMLHQHGQEWNAFIESLGTDSFVAKWVPRREDNAR